MAKFNINITGINKFDEQCRVQCAIQKIIHELGYEVNSENFKILFNDEY